jgi:NitT/TauT family transport system substrate-binding protein
MMTQSVSYCRTCLLGALALLFSFSSVTAWSETARQLRIGVQFGLGYLPLYVAKDAGFFERRIREEGLDSIPVEFSHLAGGPQVNDGLLSHSLEIGSG